MLPFSRSITLTMILALIGLSAACAGPQSEPRDTLPDVEEETLPAASPAPSPEPSQPVQPAASENSGPASIQISEKIKFMYEDVYFKRGSTRLDQAAKMLLDKKARWLNDHPDIKVIIEGHTDDRGSKEYNLALGDRRSGAVKSYLMKKGIARERLIAISYGKEKPAVAGRTEKDRAKNRRVHFAIEE